MKAKVRAPTKPKRRARRKTEPPAMFFPCPEAERQHESRERLDAALAALVAAIGEVRSALADL